MFWAILFICELTGLFFLSQELTKLLSSFLLRFTKNQKTTIYILSALFFPGVFIHEFAHLIFANALFVQTGEIEFLPQVQGDFVKLGSVAIAKSDPFRRFFIGVAPVIAGVAIMFGLFYYLSPFFPEYNWQTLVLIYIFFEIGNTMFSSKKDMEGAVALLIAIVVLAIALYILGLRIQINFLAFVNLPIVHFFLQTACLLLLIPLFINLLFILLARFVLIRRR